LRLVGEAELEDIAVGAAILGTGGGGDPHIGKLLAHDLQVRRILHAHPGTDRCRKRHHRRTAGIEKFFSHYQIVREIRQNDKALFDENFCGLESLLVVRQESYRIADYFELKPMSFQCLAGKSCRSDRMFGVIAASRVGQDLHFRIEMIEKRFGLAVERHAVNGDGYHFSAGRLVRRFHFVE